VWWFRAFLSHYSVQDPHLLNFLKIEKIYEVQINKTQHLKGSVTLLPKDNHYQLSTVAHSYNPNYQGCTDRRITLSGQFRQKVRPYLKKITKSKRGLEAWGSSRVQA
jgi:hypothetical protein